MSPFAAAFFTAFICAASWSFFGEAAFALFFGSGGRFGTAGFVFRRGMRFLLIVDVSLRETSRP